MNETSQNTLQEISCRHKRQTFECMPAQINIKTTYAAHVMHAEIWNPSAPYVNRRAAELPEIVMRGGCSHPSPGTAPALGDESNKDSTLTQETSQVWFLNGMIFLAVVCWYCPTQHSRVWDKEMVGYDWCSAEKMGRDGSWSIIGRLR